MATLSAWPNTPNSSAPNQNLNFLSPDQLSDPHANSSSSTVMRQQDQQQFDTAAAVDDSVDAVSDDHQHHQQSSSPTYSDASNHSFTQNHSPNSNNPPLPFPPPIRTSVAPSPAPNSPNSLSNVKRPNLLHVSFNQDFGCFASGTDRGFRIYNCDPFRELFRRDFDPRGGIGSVAMLFRCNILALVGGGLEPQYPLNKVMIWDDHQGRCIGELSFRSEVRGVLLRRDRIIVVLEQKVFVYNIADLRVLHQIETFANPKGLCVVSQAGANFVLVCPGLQKGQVRVEHYASKRTKFIMAHDSRVVSFALSQDGALLATASTKGTLVRIFNTSDGTLLQEVRRGADRAEIHSLAFSSTAHWLAVSSDKGTVHVFGVKIPGSPAYENSCNPSESNGTSTTASSGSSLSFIKGVLPKYIFSEWSVAQFRLIEGTQYTVAFGHQKNTIVILGMDGSFYRCRFDPMKGGEMIQLEYHNFLKPDEPF